jgi:hypothetical protein
MSADVSTTPDGFAAFESWLGNPLPENPIAALRQLRREAAAEIERLLAFLDALGGDPDLEPSGDELDASVPEGPGGSSRASQHPNEDDEADGTDEPSLASPEGATCPDRPKQLYAYVSMPDPQTSWARGNSADLEGDPREDDEDSHDAELDLSDQEPDVDDEPNGDADTSGAPDNPKYAAALRRRRGQVAGVPPGFCNVDMSRARRMVNGCPVGPELRLGPDGRLIR